MKYLFYNTTNNNIDFYLESSNLDAVIANKSAINNYHLMSPDDIKLTSTEKQQDLIYNPALEQIDKKPEPNYEINKTNIEIAEEVIISKLVPMSVITITGTKTGYFSEILVIDSELNLTFDLFDEFRVKITAKEYIETEYLITVGLQND